MSVDRREDLVIRRHERQDVRMRATVRVSRSDGDVVRFSESAPSMTNAGADTVLVDIGRGGLGFECPVFFPRGAVVDVTVNDPDGNGALLTCRGVVRRTSMVDRTPTYAAGVQFIEPSQEALEAIDAISQGGVM